MAICDCRSSRLHEQQQSLSGASCEHDEHSVRNCCCHVGSISRETWSCPWRRRMSCAMCFDRIL
jgi:hypothetical protein